MLAGGCIDFRKELVLVSQKKEVHKKEKSEESPSVFAKGVT